MAEYAWPSTNIPFYWSYAFIEEVASHLILGFGLGQADAHAHINAVILS
jgi:hypothetical protein